MTLCLVEWHFQVRKFDAWNVMEQVKSSMVPLFLEPVLYPSACSLVLFAFTVV